MPRVLEQIRRMKGGAQSHLMRCEDGYYVVKFQNNPQHRRVLVNELLGTRLVGRLGLRFTHTLPVRRAPELTRNLAYTADRISSKAPWKSEFAAVTDVALSDGIPLQRFVRDALRDAGIEPVPLDHFAVCVAKLKPMIQ